MKKAALTLALISVTVFLIGLSVNNFQVVRVAKANPYTAPELSFLSPKNNTAYNTTSIPFNFLAESISFMDFDYFYSLDDRVSKEPIPVKLVSQKRDLTTYDIFKTYQFSIDLQNLSDGQHILTIHHEGEYDSSAPGEKMVREGSEPPIIFYIDTVAPTITNLSINATGSTDRLLDFTVVEEAVWIGYSLDNQANVTINGETVLSELPVGSHNVTVYAEDTAGNIGASETFFFTIAEPSLESSEAILVLASTGAVSAVIIGIIVYLKKRK